EPPSQRPTAFVRGLDVVDARNGGFVAPSCDPRQQPAEGFCFDTRLVGNSNDGHVYGTALSPAEKSDLLAYLLTFCRHAECHDRCRWLDDRLDAGAGGNAARRLPPTAWLQSHRPDGGRPHCRRRTGLARAQSQSSRSAVVRLGATVGGHVAD